MKKFIKTTINNMPSDFDRWGQLFHGRDAHGNCHFGNEVCGYTEQEGFEEIEDIPSNYMQCKLPGKYGEYLTITEITNFALIENGQLTEKLKTLNTVTAELSALAVESVIHEYEEVTTNE